jgi:hypothetical protein
MKLQVKRKSSNVLYIGDQLGEYRVVGFLGSPNERVLLEKDNYWRDRWDAKWAAAKQYEERVIDGRTFMDDHR